MSFSGFALAALHTSITNTQSNEHKRDYLLDQSVRNQTICLTQRFSASVCSTGCYKLVTCFPPLTQSYLLHAFLRLATVYSFPALNTGYMFSRAYH